MNYENSQAPFTLYMVNSPFTRVRNQEDDETISQYLYGEVVKVFPETSHGKVLCESTWDAYRGYVETEDLGEVIEYTHIVSVAATPVRGNAHTESYHICNLSLNSRVRVLKTEKQYSQTPLGWIYTPHLAPQQQGLAELAKTFIGTPYVWGGKGYDGIDCSGFVQMVYKACGVEIPRDTSVQQAMNWNEIAKGAPLQAGDLVFWKGHVGMMLDSTRIIHANGIDMRVFQGLLCDVEKAIRKATGKEVRKILRKPS